MNTTLLTCRKLALGIVAAACLLSFSGCGDFEVPITSGPTRKVDQRLLGNWVSSDGTEKMKVRRLNDSIYIVSYNGDLYQAFHSDVGKAPFVSVQDIDSQPIGSLPTSPTSCPMTASSLNSGSSTRRSSRRRQRTQSACRGS